MKKIKSPNIFMTALNSLLVITLFLSSCSKGGGNSSSNAGGPANPPPPAQTNPDVSAPTIPGSFSATAAGSNEIRLAWNQAIDDRSPAAALVYEICQSATVNGCNVFTISQSLTGINQISINGLTPQSTHYFKIRAKDQAANTSGISGTVSATTAANGAATSPMIVPQNRLSNAAFDVQITANGAGESVCYTTNGAVPLCMAAACTQGIAGGTTVTVPIAATGALRARSCHATMAASPVIDGNYAIDNAGPTMIAYGIYQDLFDVNAIEISWDPAEDNHSPRENLRYQICFSANPGACDGFPVFDTTAVNVNTYRFQGLNPLSTYYVRIRAVDEVGNIGLSTEEFEVFTEALGTVAAPVFTPHAGGTHVLPPAGADIQITTTTPGAIICFAEAPTFPSCAPDGNACQTGTMGNQVTVLQNAVLRAVGCKNNFARSAVIRKDYHVDNAPPTVPAALTTSMGGSGEIMLSWQASTDVSPPITYEICQTNAPGGCDAFTVSYSVTTLLTHAIANLPPGTLHYYRIRAKDVHDQTSAASAEVPGKSGGTNPICTPDQPGWSHAGFFKSPYASAHMDSSDISGSAYAPVAVSGDTMVLGFGSENINFRGIVNGATIPDQANPQNYSGAVHVYRQVGPNWVREAYIKASNSLSGMYFGTSVSLDGDTLVVGTPYESNNHRGIIAGTHPTNSADIYSSGAVYVFKRNGNQWTQEAYIKPSNSSEEQFFGHTLAISGDTLVVGAWGENNNVPGIINGGVLPTTNAGTYIGAVYVFKRNPVTRIWHEESYIKPPTIFDFSTFPTSLALEGDRLVAGSTIVPDEGKALVYLRTGNAWALQATLTAPNGNAYDNFGYSVGISGNKIVVGAPQEDSNQSTITNGPGGSADNSMTEAGAAYVFRYDGAAWVREAYLKARNVSPRQQFGFATAIRGDRIVVGAPYENSSYNKVVNNGGAFPVDSFIPGAGAAHVYEFSGGIWTNTAYLKSPANHKDGYFGSSVALQDNAIAIGRPGDRNAATEPLMTECGVPTGNVSSSKGAVHLFYR
jgi:FG-GAP repeat